MTADFATSDLCLLTACSRNRSMTEVIAGLRAGANPYTMDSTRTTALMWACVNHRSDSAHALLEAGADPDLANEAGETALSLACHVGQIQLVEALLDWGADINHRALDGLTALHICSKITRHEIALLLIARGADLNASSACLVHSTPLMLAAAHGQPIQLAALIQAGADPCLMDTSLQTALHWAADSCYGRADALAALVAAGAVIDARARFGVTPLMLAARLGSHTLTRTLLDLGADACVVDAIGHNAEQYAFKADHFELSAHLHSYTLSLAEAHTLSDAIHPAPPALGGPRI